MLIKFIQVLYWFSIKLRRKDSELLWKLFAGDKGRIWFVLPSVVGRGVTCCLLASGATLRMFLGLRLCLLSNFVGGDAVGDLLQRLISERHELGQLAVRRRRR